MIEVIEEKGVYDPTDLEYPFKVYIDEAEHAAKESGIAAWIDENINGRWTYRNQGETFLFRSDEKNVRKFPMLFVYTFEEEDEAVAFKLRWV